MERNVCILDIECHHIPVTGSNGFKAQKWYNLEEHQQSCFIGCQYCTFKKHGFGELCCWNWLDNSASILRLILGLENFGSSFLDTLVCMLIMHAWVYNMYVCMCIYIYESGPRTMVWSHPPPHPPKPRICFSIWEAQPPICTFFLQHWRATTSSYP